MLKKRIIPIQLLKDGRLVKGTQFANYRDVGDPVSSSAVYNSQQADELIFLNTNSELGIQPLLDIIDEVAEVTFMPIAMGGGITCYEDAAQLIERGADKIVLNSVCYRDSGLIETIANTFGCQSIVVSIDVKESNDGWSLYSNNGRQHQSIGLLQHIKNVEQAGAGEIMIQSIDRDGTMAGFDIELAQFLATSCKVPVILAGGSGNYEQLKQVFENADISAIACGSLFNFSDSNPMRAMAFLRNYNLPFKKV